MIRSVKRERTEHCKALRREYGDNSGLCRFSDKRMTIGSDIMGTITTISKDNLIFDIEI